MKWGGGLLQAGWQAAVRWDVEGVADARQQAEYLSVSGVVGGSVGKEMLPMHLALLPVVEDLLNE